MSLIQQLLVAFGISLVQLLIQHAPDLVALLAQGLEIVKTKLSVFLKPANSVPSAA